VGVGGAGGGSLLGHPKNSSAIIANAAPSFHNFFIFFSCPLLYFLQPVFFPRIRIFQTPEFIKFSNGKH
jgi:hypothetical protein